MQHLGVNFGGILRFELGFFICSFVRYKNLDRSFFRFVTIHAFDRRTDGQTDGHFSHRWSVLALHAARKKMKWKLHVVAELIVIIIIIIHEFHRDASLEQNFRAAN